MKEKKLGTLLKGSFRPLEDKEGKLRGGFGTLDSNTNCHNCSCTNNSCKPSSSSSSAETSLSAPSGSDANIGMMGLF